MSLFFIWNEGRGVSGVGSEGALSGLPIPLVVLSAGHMLSTLFLQPTPGFPSRLLRNGSSLFGLLYLSVYNLSQLLLHVVIFSPYSFSVFVSGGEACPGASIVQNCNKDPRPGLSEDKARSAQEANGFPNSAQQCGTIRQGLINGHKNRICKRSREGKAKRERKKRQGAIGMRSKDQA